MQSPTTRKISPALIGMLCTLAVVGFHPVWSAETDEAASIEGAMAAYDELVSVVEAKDLEGFKTLMSFGLTARMTQDWMFAEGFRSGPEYFEKVPKASPAIDGDQAVFSKTYDEDTVTATYSIEFVREEGRWKFDGYKTSSRSK